MMLVIVRHGETLWNRENIFTGWEDIPLSKEGEKEAYHAGMLLKQEHILFDAAYTSCLKRSIQSLNIMLDCLNLDWLEVVKDWRLNERHYGILQGQSKIKSIDKYGKENIYRWRRNYDARPPQFERDDHRNPIFTHPYRLLDKSKLPCGESLHDCAMRIMPAFDELIKPGLMENKTLLLSMHANSIRALFSIIMNLSPHEINELFIPTSIPMIISFNEDFTVQSFRYLGNQEQIERKISKQKKTLPNPENQLK